MKRFYKWGKFGQRLGDSWFLLVFCGITLIGSAAQNIEMRLEGQIERRQPFPSMTTPMIKTGTVGRVELNLWDGGSSFSERAGIYSFANDRGSFAIHSTTSPAALTNSGWLRWKGEFNKLADNVPFTYTVNPTILYLVVPGGDATNRCLAGWKITDRQTRCRTPEVPL